MYFCGQTFIRDSKSSQSATVNIKNITSIILENGIYDDLFITRNTSNADKKWTFDTVLYALFNNDLLAGNINFAIDSITSIRIKRREKGTFDWITICDIPINSVEDLSFVRTYRYCKGNTNYEFAMIPVLNSTIEGNLSIAECFSDFDGVYLMEEDAAIHMMLNFESSQERNHNATTVQTLGREKPYYITNGMANFETGSINVTLIRMNDNCAIDVQNGASYRKSVNDVLTNKKPKILKFDDGRMFLVGIVENISQSSDPLIPISTINWVEIGDVNNEQDLYDNGFMIGGGLV